MGQTDLSPAPGRALAPIAAKRANRRVLAAARPRRFPIETGASLPVILDRQMRDFVIPEDSRPPFPDVDSLTRLSDSRHFRVHGSVEQGFGYYEYCGLDDDGLFVCIFDITYSAPLPTSIIAEDMLRILIASEGDGEYATADGAVLDLKGPGAAIIIEPPGQSPADSIMAGHNLAAHVYIHRNMLSRLYARDRHELPAAVQAFIAGELQHTVAQRLPLTPQLLRFLDDLRNCTLEGYSRRLVIQSKAIEILCHAFEAMAQDENGGGFPEASKLAANGVLKAQRLLAENFVDPPSLDRLAHEVGMSRSGLCAAFRQIVGQSVFDYVADLRMQQALAMLSRQDSTISEVAYAVGYGHPSSFSVAVQRRFGTTASELRRRGLPPA